MKISCLALLAVGIILFCSFPADATTYPEGVFDFTTIHTKTTLEAKHIIVGEVVDVSSVFELPKFNQPFSFVTIHIERDIKQEIKRAAQQGGNRNAGHADESKPTVTFVQLGGPYPDGSVVRASGVPVLKPGDRVFLRLIPTIESIQHGGQKSDVTISEFACRYSLKEKGKTLDEHIVKCGWQGMDVTVLQMARITRATLETPERIKALERRMNALAR
ncbi:hypothetical protein IH992_18030, partial [Candidatus Poribacteria bacterium]|nr:hypothetical protein [Candidatus Poribacteria bacterium]